MTNVEKIARILDAHSIPYYIDNGRIYADAMLTGAPMFAEAVDLTDYTRPDLYAWLGY